MKPTIGTLTGGAPLEIDLERLVAGRALLTANSGAGKSWALRRILEQTHGSIQQLVIDPEGEFYTLRERFDYVLAGRGGDCAAEPRSAALLARRLLELGVSAILDLYELAPRDRVRFVRAFVEALVDAPKALWHPVLVVVDEAHAFAPEKGHGEAESTEAIARLMAQGRKRGFAGILATQRLAKLAKDVAAEANNLLVGRAALDVDLARAGDSLGFPKAERHRIRSLRPGHFFAFGPALCPEVAEVTVGEILTSHPRAGAATPMVTPPRAAVQAVLAELADLPAEAEQEARSVEELRAKLRESERKLAQAARTSVDPEALDRARSEGFAAGEAAARRAIATLAASATASRERAARAIDGVIAHLKAAGEGLVGASDALREPLDVPEIEGGSPGAAGPRWSVAALRLPRTSGFAHSNQARAAAPSARSGEARMLEVLAQHYPTGIREGQWAALAGLKRSGGTWSTYKSRLRTAGHLRQDGALFFATEAGVEAAGVVPERPASAEEVLALWCSKPGMGPVIPLVEAVVFAPRLPLARAALAEHCGLTASGGTFSTYLSRARTAELIADRDGGLVPGAVFEGMD